MCMSVSVGVDVGEVEVCPVSVDLCGRCVFVRHDVPLGLQFERKRVTSFSSHCRPCATSMVKIYYNLKLY